MSTMRGCGLARFGVDESPSPGGEFPPPGGEFPPPAGESASPSTTASAVSALSSGRMSAVTARGRTTGKRRTHRPHAQDGTDAVGLSSRVLSASEERLAPLIGRFDQGAAGVHRHHLQPMHEGQHLREVALAGADVHHEVRARRGDGVRDQLSQPLHLMEPVDW
eukprot:1189974-Prorocentrum_minimum.AAC.3